MQETQIFLESVVLIALGSTQVKPAFQLGCKTQLTCWVNPSGQVTKVSWVLEPAYSAQLGSLKQTKSQVLAAGFVGFISLPKQQNPQSWVHWLGSRTQLTQVYLGLETQLTLPSLAGFIKTLKAGFSLADGFPGFVAAKATQQNPEARFAWVLEPNLPSLSGWVH